MPDARSTAFRDTLALVQAFSRDATATADVVATMSPDELRRTIGQLLLVVHVACDDVDELVDDIRAHIARRGDG